MLTLAQHVVFIRSTKERVRRNGRYGRGLDTTGDPVFDQPIRPAQLAAGPVTSGSEILRIEEDVHRDRLWRIAEDVAEIELRLADPHTARTNLAVCSD